MGYFKNLEVELQDIHDKDLRDIVAWDHAHRHMLTADERWRILTNEVLLKRALVLWENTETPAPLPAKAHVALQTKRRDHRPPRKSRMCLVGWSLILIAIGAGIIILVVSL
jgi:hypothetical protein